MKKDAICSMAIFPENHQNNLTISIRSDQKSFYEEFVISISDKLEAFHNEINNQKQENRYEFNYSDFFIKFFSFVHNQAQSKYIVELEKKVEELEKEISSTQSIQKIPVSLFNVMLTTKDATLEKLQKKIIEISNKIPETHDEKRLIQLKKQLKIANEIHQKASINFPEDFHFSVYEQYSIYGGFKLLSDNKFSPVEMYFTDILRALNFDKINRKEVTEIRKAFNKLTKQKFPCYFIRTDNNDINKYIFYDGDEPIFKIWEFGSLDLNIDLSDQNIVKKKLFLSIANPALLNDINNFYSIINSNLLAELRNFKKVSEDDLYFIAFLLKEMRFHINTSISFTEICKKIKKNEWLSENGQLVDRERKRQIKNKILPLLEFTRTNGLITSFEIENDLLKIKYKNMEKCASEIVHES